MRSLPVKCLGVLFFLLAARVQCAQSMGFFAWRLSDESFDAHRVFKSFDTNAACVVELNYAYERKNFRKSTGEVSIVNKETGQNLMLSMDYGNNPEATVQTRLLYMSYPGKNNKKNTFKARASIDSLPNNTEGGKTTFSLPGRQMIDGWIPVLYHAARPEICALIEGDKEGVDVTRYLWTTGDDDVGVFVRMQMAYRNLNIVNISWGKSHYGGYAFYGARADVDVSEDQRVVLEVF